MGAVDESAEPSAPPAEEPTAAPSNVPKDEVDVPAPAPTSPTSPTGAPVTPSSTLEGSTPLSPQYEIGASARSVIITGLSATVTEDMVREFVEFCGDVVSIDLKPDANSEGRFMSIVEFEDVNSVDDALICSGAIIGDSAITVSNLEVIDGTPDGLDRAVVRAKSASETVQKVVAAGYVKGEQAITVVKQKALQFDETHKVSEKVRGANIPGKAKGVATAVSSSVTATHAKITGKPKEASEEQKTEYQTAGQRTWSTPASSQPQW